MTSKISKGLEQAVAHAGGESNGVKERTVFVDKSAPKSTLPRSLIAVLPIAADVAKQVDAAAQLLSALDAELIVCRRSDAATLARAFVVLRRLKDKVDELDKSFTALFEQYKNVYVPEALENAKLSNVTLAEGFRVTISSRIYASIKEGMRDAAYAWLKKHKLGSIIVGTVNASTLSAVAKTLLEESNAELPDDLFTVSPVMNTSVTQVKE